VNTVRFAFVLFLALLAFGCVERKLYIRTEPEGAIVSVNGTELGASPVSWKFQHYGTVRVTLRKAGYETEQRIVKLKTPWYEYPVLDLFSDVIVPATIKDDHHMEVTMNPRESAPKEVDKANASAFGERAVALRASMRAEIAAEAAPGSSPKPAVDSSPKPAPGGESDE